MTIPGWNLERPDEEALIADFAKSMGADAAEKIWALACHQLGLSRPVEDLDDLVRAADAMVDIGGLMRVAGRGARIRTVTYRALATRV
ncbi:hypothetical protein [Actinoplanes sp. GCM10030250]|uniref:hypothetical protein n=1 Tax=Actinoplanes sp. GCM10030250 TaxID=3273376 RepID=UPI003617141D